jgi:tRNA A37 threonylcarbamoyladenosine synthetase subunit TsaC/SUA5/YrdC
MEPSTVIDLTGEEPVLVRPGRGSLEPFGLAAENPQ